MTFQRAKHRGLNFSISSFIQTFEQRTSKELLKTSVIEKVPYKGNEDIHSNYESF